MQETEAVNSLLFPRSRSSRSATAMTFMHIYHVIVSNCQYHDCQRDYTSSLTTRLAHNRVHIA